MRTALLVCDHVPSILLEKHGDYPHMYQHLFPDLNLDTFYVCDQQFPEVNNFDLFIITGSRYSVYDDIPWVKKLQDYVRQIFEEKKKCIGICFGHQMIAEALGGKVEKAPVGFLIGVHTFYVQEFPRWFGEEKSEYNILMLCQDQVVRLPADATLLAGNQLCPVGMYHIQDRFFAVQGHPEFSKEYDRDVFLSRKERMGEEKIEQALESFQLDPDVKWLREIMMNFLGEKMLG